MVVTPFLPQSFFFDWNTPGQPVPIPTTEQCETIHIVWARSTAVGPNPTSPYHLQVYTSTSTIPLVIPAGDGLSFDWPVPFAPGTQYQICMFDKFGNTGGCQDTYTVIPPRSIPNCANVTFPPALEVQAQVENGPMSQYGWVDQCTDISVQPLSGTPPYTLTVAPSLHPPYNITSPDTKPINWTVSLSWASQFFVSLVDADGSMWSNGPLHSGGGGTIACLAGNVTTDFEDTVKPAVAIGAGVGGLVVGLLFGALIAFIFLRRNYKKKLSSARFVDVPGSASGSPNALLYDQRQGQGSSQYRPLPTVSSSSAGPSNNPSIFNRTTQGSMQYQVEPFVIPSEDGQLYREPRSPGSAYGPSIPGGRAASSAHEHLVPPVPTPAPAQPPSQVYVVHHDSQTPPVTIYHQDGTQIVELPPRYPPHSAVQSEALSDARSGSDSRSDGSRNDRSAILDFELQQTRQPGPARKSTRRAPS
ncbi:unnamed protein product [Cyclocybe aegerita]|uniref:Uncharacterized protein n=1 Tax=Cyclocybe aegerita TaxID=1973307 RepID=A0A8S0VQH3_CYCAE|nr:unnamed protein product [Cyclocybe aegerita]